MHNSNLIVEILRNFWFNILLIGLGATAVVYCIRRWVKRREIANKYHGFFFSGLTLIIILQFFQRSFSPQSFPGIVISLVIEIIFVISIFYFYLGIKKEKREKDSK